MPFATRTTAPASSAVAKPASTARFVTPTIDEFEQASFYANQEQQGISIQPSSYNAKIVHQPPPPPKQQQQCHCQPTLSGLESIIDATLPSSSSSFYYAPTDGQATTTSLVNDCIPTYDALATAASLASLAMATPLQSTVFVQPSSSSNAAARAKVDDVNDAADILCQFKNSPDVCTSIQDAFQIVDMAVDLLSSEDGKKMINEDEGGGDETMDGDDDDTQEEEEYEEEEDDVANNNVIANDFSSSSLVRPTRLAAADDAEEVNKLHQYVRKDLLEIFAVPQADTTSDEEEEDSDENEEEGKRTRTRPTKKQKVSTTKSNATKSTRNLVTRRRSITVPTTLPTTSEQRYYPGRVGLRCVHCANVPSKNKCTKAAFYPLRLKNIYREVCAWQRIHFKKCKHVPVGVRERYDHYKQIDTSRGKVRYWESSARKIGLTNNPDRYVCVFLINFFSLSLQTVHFI